ncbi:MAG: hypothetical protein DRZ76_03445 [Candidatus Nealsonbacteria bacterium]|nr:MAG: hypothetical protein DRZ76_03445 [Candidatus Nealsonbacteria bacterium]
MVEIKMNKKKTKPVKTIKKTKLDDFEHLKKTILDDFKYLTNNPPRVLKWNTKYWYDKNY